MFVVHTNDNFKSSSPTFHTFLSYDDSKGLKDVAVLYKNSLWRVLLISRALGT
jgi:hypothetical protein